MPGLVESQSRRLLATLSLSAAGGMCLQRIDRIAYHGNRYRARHPRTYTLLLAPQVIHQLEVMPELLAALGLCISEPQVFSL